MEHLNVVNFLEPLRAAMEKEFPKPDYMKFLGILVGVSQEVLKQEHEKLYLETCKNTPKAKA
jgi:hypothetical protein